MRILYVLHSDGQLILHIGQNLGIGVQGDNNAGVPRGIAATFGFIPACEAIVAKARRKPSKVSGSISGSLIRTEIFR